MRSRNRKATFCFKTSNDVGYNDSEVTRAGTSLQSLSDTMHFDSEEFGVNLSYLLPGGDTRRYHSDGYLQSLKSAVEAFQLHSYLELHP